VPAGQLSSDVWPNDRPTPAAEARMTSKKIIARMGKTLIHFKTYRPKFDKSMCAS
jgi:hypothetical protein